jgi:parallel beta-helix repeat protein
MKKIWVLLILVCFVGAALILFPSNASAEVTGTQVPEQGDWIINDATVATGETIEFTGMIIIEDGGSLTLNDVDLKFKSSTHGKCGITVKKGGSFITDGGSITKSGTGNYSFRGFSGATVTLVDTTITYVGYQLVDYSLNTVTEDYRFSGMWLECDATITGCTVDKTFNGIIPENGTVTIKGSTVSNGNWHNIEGRGATIIMDNCTFFTTLEQCNVELYWDCDAVLKNSIIYSAWHENVWGSPRVKMTVENNKIYNSNQGGVWFKEDCDVTIRNNEIYTNDWFGVWIEKDSKAVIEGNTITNNGDPTNPNGNMDNPNWEGNGQGIVIIGSEATIKDNTVEGSWGDTLLAENSQITASGNTFKGSKEEDNVVIRESTGTLTGNTISASTNDAILAHNSTLTISDNTIDTAGGYAICNTGSTLTMSGNTITAAAKGEEFKGHYMTISP